MIRYYEIEDIEAIAKILDDNWKSAYRGMIDDDYLDNLNYKDREQRLRSKYVKEKSLVYVENKEILGFCRLGESREGLEDYGEVIALYVKEDEHGKGIGKKLINKAKEILKSKGYNKMILWCLKENKPARGFYKNVGGVLGEERKFKIGDKEYDEVSYKYEL